MRMFFIGVLAMTTFTLATKAGSLAADEGPHITGPHTHENLALYFIHGKSADGEVPLTLDEAIKLDRVRVFETGDVNELQIENKGDQAVFIQAGDIVKGGKQDRVITSSFILKPRSGAIPLMAFCVEQGRWSRRGAESAAMFSSSAEAMPSSRVKRSLHAAAARAAAPSPRAAQGFAVQADQSSVWHEVNEMQRKFSEKIKDEVAARESQSSLQLSLENEKLQQRRGGYVDALKGAPENSGDIIGYAFAINGKINSADVYESNGLFRKMWEKQLKSAATEALAEAGTGAGVPPSLDEVRKFLSEAKSAAAADVAERNGNRLDVREGDKAVYMAASPAGGAAVHENYLAK